MRSPDREKVALKTMAIRYRILHSGASEVLNSFGVGTTGPRRPALHLDMQAPPATRYSHLSSTSGPEFVPEGQLCPCGVL